MLRRFTAALLASGCSLVFDTGPLLQGSGAGGTGAAAAGGEPGGAGGGSGGTGGEGLVAGAGGNSGTGYWVGVPTSSALFNTAMTEDSGRYGLNYQIPKGVSGVHAGLAVYATRGGGNGGNYAINLFAADSNGNPTGPSLAQAQWLGLSQDVSVHQTVIWDPPVFVSESEYYVAVWEKLTRGAADFSKLEFIAVDTVDAGGTKNASEPMPWQENQRAWGHRISLDGLSWSFREEALFEPIMEIVIDGKGYGRHAVSADGAQLGPAPGGAWYEVWLHPARNPKQVSTTNWLRQEGLQLEAGTIDKLFGSFRYSSGTGSLLIELVLEDQVVAAKVISPLSASDWADTQPQRTLGGLLDKPITIGAGQYALRLRTEGTLTLESGALADASQASYGYSKTVCSSGRMQVSSDSGASWQNSNRGGGIEAPADDSDLPFGIHYRD